jgi:cyclopropane fatty-acyl-phospholipid synthase-like methyltransferase
VNGDLYTFVAHQHLPYANPMGVETMDRAVALLDLPEDASVCEFGAGFCELALQVATRWGAKVAAIELSPRIGAGAQERIDRHIRQRGAHAKGGVSLLRGDAGTFRPSFAPESFDLCVCIGATHALGGYHKALEVMHKLTRPRGKILLGEGFWTSPEPSPSYLAATGIAADEFMLHFENVEQGVEAGLETMWAATATQRAWDEYEWAHSRAIEEFARRHPGDADAKEMLERSRNWRRAYLRWGREHLGFGLYLFRKPG